VIRVEAGMSRPRFCELIDMPDRTWRRWQARARSGDPTRGPWPQPVSALVEAVVVKHAEAHPGWGHRKVWAMTRYDGHHLSPATALRIMRRRGLILAADYQRERRQLAAARKAVFVDPPTGPNQVCQLDFSEFETVSDRTNRAARSSRGSSRASATRTARSDHVRGGRGLDRRNTAHSWRNTKISASFDRPERPSNTSHANVQSMIR
jgi:hypothetical protein